MENGISVDLVGGETQVLPTHIKVSCDWAQTDHTDKNICERQEYTTRNTQTHKEKKMVSNKNAYEIRAEVLEMAKTFVMDKFQNERANWENSVDRHPESGVILSLKDAPVYPSSNDVLLEAEKLYSFVDSK